MYVHVISCELKKSCDGDPCVSFSLIRKMKGVLKLVSSFQNNWLDHSLLRFRLLKLPVLTALLATLVLLFLLIDQICPYSLCCETHPSIKTKCTYWLSCQVQWSFQSFYFKFVIYTVISFLKLFEVMSCSKKFVHHVTTFKHGLSIMGMIFTLRTNLCFCRYLECVYCNFFVGFW